VEPAVEIVIWPGATFDCASEVETVASPAAVATDSINARFLFFVPFDCMIFSSGCPSWRGELISVVRRNFVFRQCARSLFTKVIPFGVLHFCCHRGRL
jgi:hypothetical protein